MLAFYDATLWESLGSVTNYTSLAEDDQAWLQASSPVKLGELLKLLHQLTWPQLLPQLIWCVPSFLSVIVTFPTPFIDVAQAQWSKDHTFIPPQGAAACQQIRASDGLSMTASAMSLLESARDNADHARLLAYISKESGAWLQALPISSLGLRWNDCTLRIAVVLRLGTTICVAHQCLNCS